MTKIISFPRKKRVFKIDSDMLEQAKEMIHVKNSQKLSYQEIKETLIEANREFYPNSDGKWYDEVILTAKRLEKGYVFDIQN